MTHAERLAMKQANLTLHGWFPVEVLGGFYGIYNDALKLGYWLDRVGGPVVKFCGFYNRRIEWAEMPESDLTLIEQRLRQV